MDLIVLWCIKGVKSCYLCCKSLSAMHIKIQLQPFACNWERNHSICTERTGAINQARALLHAAPFYLSRKSCSVHAISSQILRMAHHTSLAPFIALAHEEAIHSFSILHTLLAKPQKVVIWKSKRPTQLLIAENSARESEQIIHWDF